MQSYFVVVGLVLMGQLGDATGPRYTTPDNNVQIEHHQEESGQEESGAEYQPSEYPPITPLDTSVTSPTTQDLFGELPEQPAGSYSPPALATKPAVTKPSDVMRELATAPLSGQLSGVALSLAEVVIGSRSRAEQTARVEAYWKLSATVTDYYLAVRAATEVDALRQNISQPSYAWDDARLALTSRIQVARRTAEVAQHRLNSLMGRSTTIALPLPSDRPHCGAYQTRYEKNFANRPLAEAEQLNGLLPQVYEDLLKQAAALTADLEWLQKVDRQRIPQSDGTVLLKSYELVNLRRQTFIKAVFQYNMSIARYSELASPGEVGADRLVAMLISRPRVEARIDAEVSRTSAEEPIEPQSDSDRPRKTFAEESRSVPSNEEPPAEGVERSILRRPAVGSTP